jgi:CBS domain containing-hemolysin-like protein
MIIGFVIALLLLLAVSSVVIPVGTLGKFERQRREKNGHDLEVERELYYSDILSLQRVLQAILLVLTAAAAVSAFGWLIGVLLAILVALEYGALARWSVLRSQATKYYMKFEKQLFVAVQKYPQVVKYIRVFTPESSELTLHSRDELHHLIDSSHGVFDKEEKQLLLSAIGFRDQLVKSVMTPRSMIDSINRSELLGPLVLDDLHKKGHSRFPVIGNDVDHVVGILHLRDVLTLETSKKHTSRAETAMETRVFYIHEDQTLGEALTAFIKTHHHLFVVVNEYRETVGLLSLEDVIESLIGREIVDEFDDHQDLRAVAKRNPRANNTAGQDV